MELCTRGNSKLSSVNLRTKGSHNLRYSMVTLNLGEVIEAGIWFVYIEKNPDEDKSHKAHLF